MAARAELLRPRRRAIPSTQLGPLRNAARRTTAVRIALALALLAALAAAFLVSRGSEVSHSPLLPAGTSGMVVLDISASIDLRSYRRVGQALTKIARGEEPAGLVVFSDSAYELLPPGSPGRELEKLIRFFRPVGASGAFPLNPWAIEFSAGTRISSGLQAAHEALLREGTRKGAIVLISDLDSPSTDVQRLGAVIDDLRRDGIELRIVPLFPLKEKEALFERLVGTKRILKAPEPGAPVRPSEYAGIRGVAPWLFVLVAASIALLIALNERLCARLAFARRSAA